MSLTISSQNNPEKMYNLYLNKGLTRQVYNGFAKFVQKPPPVIISNRTFVSELPKLPVPSLKKSIKKLLLTVRPHVDDCAFEKTKKVAKDFQDGCGLELHCKLKERAECAENWLKEIWLQSAYLCFREPVVVHSSPGLVFPFSNFKDDTEWILYAARMISGAMSYKKKIYSDEICPEKMGKHPLDMSQYKKIFGTVRIPGPCCDTLEYHPLSKHIVVAHNNYFFKVFVMDEECMPLSIKQIAIQLCQVIENSKKPGKPIGGLTGAQRDNWATAYSVLICDPTNKESVRTIQKALFVVALDECAPCYNPTDAKEHRQKIAAEQLIHGGGGEVNGGNRWFDKTIQFVVNAKGLSGLTYEHSPAEGQPIAVMTDYILDYMKKETGKDMCDANFKGGPKKLCFNINEKLCNHIQDAVACLNSNAKNLDVDVFTFTGFGKEFIKEQKLSPDSFIQIALQLAFYRLHRTPGAQYESAATRMYKYGRTETIRSASIQSVAFARAMLNDDNNDECRVHLLREAVAAHKKYAIDAVSGYGIDRLFLALNYIAKEEKKEPHALFSDPGYIKSSHFRVSTSQVATVADAVMAYGPLVKDGYAACYNPRCDDINFAITAMVCHPDTKASKFRSALQCSLTDMQHLLCKSKQKSKL